MDKMLRVYISPSSSPISQILENDFKNMLVECGSPKFFQKKYHNVNDILNDLKNEMNINIQIYNNNVLMFHPSGVKALIEFEIRRELDKYCLKINSPITKNTQICCILGCELNDKYCKTVDLNNFNLFYQYIKNVINGIYNYKVYIPYDCKFEKTVDIVDSMIMCEINRLTNILEDCGENILNKTDIHSQIDLWCLLKNWNGQQLKEHPGSNIIKNKIMSNIDEISDKTTYIIGTEPNYQNNDSLKKIIKMLNCEFTYWMFLVNSL